MSLNHYIPSDSNIPEAASQRWSKHTTMESSSSRRRHHHLHGIADEESDDEGHNAAGDVPKEPMFQKPLTPSDVGKLNRLVIPKQHAEKYFPLDGGDAGDQKGSLLSFEDEAGKCWRFRYSYWNSSQSYVLTKGWSRFVKEKKLDAGDVVLFLRHRLDGGRMFIGWRRKDGSQPSAGGGWRPDAAYYPLQRGSTAYSSNNDYTHAGSVPPNLSAPVINNHNANSNNNSSSNNNIKRLRLFGVNLECQAVDSDQSEPSTPVGSPMSTSTSHGQAQAHSQPYYHQYYNHYNFTNINFSGGDFYR